jgi:hypothetical protein
MAVAGDTGACGAAQHFAQPLGARDQREGCERVGGAHAGHEAAGGRLAQIQRGLKCPLLSRAVTGQFGEQGGQGRAQPISGFRHELLKLCIGAVRVAPPRGGLDHKDMLPMPLPIIRVR